MLTAQRNELREGDAVVLCKRLHELEAHAAAAEVLEGIGGVSTLWIERGHGTGQLIVGHMVVADDEIYSHLLGACYFLDGFDAAVEYDDELYTCLSGMVQSFLADAIAFFVAVGDIVFNV